MTKVTAVIPNYNQSHYVVNAIRSILKQTYRVFEIIVVDDGSTDHSREAVTQFGDAVRYIYQENQGLGGARNTGIRAATGELIGLLDADDEWHPNYLEQMVALAGKYPDALAFYCMAQGMDIDGNRLPQHFGGPAVSPSKLYQTLLRANFLIPSTVMIRRSGFDSIGLFEQDNREIHGCEDWDLWLRIAPYYEIVGTSKCLAGYRIHSNALSASPEKMQKAAEAVIKKHFGIDDGAPSTWSPEKRRAYGGVYRYQCITFVQRQNNWDACLPLMRKAVQTDPSLALDLNFFYELTLGAQPVGYRGVSELQGFEENAVRLQQLVRESAQAQADKTIYKQALGTALYALGLASYNLGTRSLFRKYFCRAFVYRPELILETRLIAKYFSSFLSKEGMEKLKRRVRRPS